MEKLIIDRNSWLRGESGSRLYRSLDGKMCCLGFYLQSKGISLDDMKDKSTPGFAFSGDRKDLERKVPSWLIDSVDWRCHSDACRDLMRENDNQDEDLYGVEFEQRKEANIKKLFALNGVEVEFVEKPMGEKTNA